ncbi:MAG: OpgC domain-containing protein [Opitutaceae bacterium]
MPKSSLPSVARDQGLDSLRGLMLVGMAVNHITSHLQVLTDHPFGYTSTAEGFVFLSGLVAGLVYTRRQQRLGLAAATKSSVLRAVTIYRYHLALFGGLLVWTVGFYALTGRLAGNAPPAMLHHPWLSLASGAFLTYQPPLLDILPMYAGFMLMLPTVLWALDQGYYRGLLVLSFIGWAVTNLYWPAVPLVHGVVQIGAFNWGAWQFVFLCGAVCGHSKATSVSLLPRWQSGLILPALAFCIWCFLMRHWYLPAPFANFADWVNKNNLAPARLVNTFALFFLVHTAFVRWPKLFVWPPLALLGRHSLAVFTTHVAVAYVLYAFPQYVSATTALTWIGTAIMLAALFGVGIWREKARRSIDAATKARGKLLGFFAVRPKGARS